METQILMTVALVAMVRHYIPKIDGGFVLLLGILAAAAVVFAGAGDFAGHWMELAQRAVLVTVGALGGVKVADRLVDRHASAVVAAPPE